MFVNNSMTVII